MGNFSVDRTLCPKMDRIWKLHEIPKITEESIGLWHKCTQCNEVSFRGELERNGFICPKCKELFPLSIENRLKLLTGENSPDTTDALSSEVIEFTTDILAIEEEIAGYPVSLFILDPDSPVLQQHLTVFSEAVACALKKINPATLRFHRESD